ncbi:hypothetical protein [Pseudoalteromonas sp. MMG012]|uniref:hypothetical protein n=1 Tax=Pseudoalteromonas sp. MMG012 TaxID=2822686 RepID=UPI001B3A065E|nr:hypothetical protein [Pseudoalteromonas sp. MMG012]MBQ4852825.1 hypothetical protein [Pseudoalteromonas sp. MMG012]
MTDTKLHSNNDDISTNLTFNTPAFIQDLSNSPVQQAQLNAIWNTYLYAFVEQATPSSEAYFYNPATTTIPNGTASAPVTWNAFPGRLQQYFSASTPVSPSNPYNLSLTQLRELADTGSYTSNGQPQALQDIPAVFCPEADWSGTLNPFLPYGPRGWQDEYCEWAVQKNGEGNITRVDFACENPEYWHALWSVSPDTVARLYQDTLNFDAPASCQITVSVDDLTLKDQHGHIVVDPVSGHPVYNPLNKWNNSPISNRQSANMNGGVMHLTSTPNTLQTEIGLAGFSTPQYESGNESQQQLLCCGQFGQAYRHSDPHIGQTVNQIVGGQFIENEYFKVNLANPFGLYIQQPQSLDSWTFSSRVKKGVNVPADAKASDIWQIIRGSTQINDPITSSAFPGNLILHAICQIPSAWLAMDPTLTLADIEINGAPIQWGSQITEQIDIGLFARPLSASTMPPQVPCAGPSAAGAPLQAMQQHVWDAYYAVNETNPAGSELSLASNSVIVPAVATAGTTVNIALTVNKLPAGVQPIVKVLTGSTDGSYDPTTTVSVVDKNTVAYAVPGNSGPGTYTSLSLAVTTEESSVAGLRAIEVSYTGAPPQTMASLIHVQPKIKEPGNA